MNIKNKSGGISDIYSAFQDKFFPPFEQSTLLQCKGIHINTNLTNLYSDVAEIKIYAEDQQIKAKAPDLTCEKYETYNWWGLENVDEKKLESGFRYILERNGEQYILFFKLRKYAKQRILIYRDYCEVWLIELEPKKDATGWLGNETGNNILLERFDWRGEEDEKNLRIVGFSYQVNNQRDSKGEWKTKNSIGKITSKKTRIADGYNQEGYGESYAFLNENNKIPGPFFSIVGGVAEYQNGKKESWGIATNQKFLLYEGYSWNGFSNSKENCKFFVYLLSRENSDNILCFKVMTTSSDSRRELIKKEGYGDDLPDKESINWGSSYGWTGKDEGYNYFELFIEEELTNLKKNLNSESLTIRGMTKVNPLNNNYDIVGFFKVYQNLSEPDGWLGTWGKYSPNNEKEEILVIGKKTSKNELIARGFTKRNGEYVYCSAYVSWEKTTSSNQAIQAISVFGGFWKEGQEIGKHWGLSTPNEIEIFDAYDSYSFEWADTNWLGHLCDLKKYFFYIQENCETSNIKSFSPNQNDVKSDLWAKAITNISRETALSNIEFKKDDFLILVEQIQIPPK